MHFHLPPWAHNPKVLLIGGAVLAAGVLFFVLRRGRSSGVSGSPDSSLTPLDRMPASALPGSSTDSSAALLAWLQAHDTPVPSTAIPAGPGTPPPPLPYSAPGSGAAPGLSIPSSDAGNGSNQNFTAITEPGGEQTIGTEQGYNAAQTAYQTQNLSQYTYYDPVTGRMVTSIVPASQLPPPPAPSTPGKGGAGAYDIMPHGPWSHAEDVYPEYVDAMRSAGIVPRVRPARRSLRMFGDLLGIDALRYGGHIE